MTHNVSLTALSILEAIHEMPASRAAALYSQAVDDLGNEAVHLQIIHLAEQFMYVWDSLSVVERLALFQLPKSTWISSTLEDLANRGPYRWLFFKTDARVVREVTQRLLEGSKL